jgi:hypothetical protein
VLLTALGAPAGAETPGFDACDANTAMRLSFIEKRLDAHRRHNAYWWKGWTTVYAAGIVVEGARAGMEDDKGKRADYVVGAAKSVLGTAQLLLDPPVGRHGAEPLQALPASDPESCARRLAAAEALLRTSAEESRERFSWQAHVANVALNLAGALIVTQGFDEKRGWTSGALGVAVGEAMLWSRPWRADEDLAEYEDFVARQAGARPRPTWRLVADGHSARIEIRY